MTSLVDVPTLNAVARDLQAACKRSVILLPASHPAPSAGPRLPDPPPVRRTLLYETADRCYEVTVVATQARAFQKLRWNTPWSVVSSLRAFDAVVLIALPEQLPEQEGRACVYDLNRRHVRVGYWHELRGQLERTAGMNSIDYFMSDLTLVDSRQRRWVKITGKFGATDWVTELPCYAGPAVLTHSADGPRQLWHSWPHPSGTNQEFDESDPGRTAQNMTVAIDIQSQDNEEVRILTGPSLIDPSSPMGFSLLPSWIGYCPSTRELTVALENGDDPALIASVSLSDALAAPVKLYAIDESGCPICVATGNVGAGGRLNQLMQNFTTVAANVVAPVDVPNYVTVTPAMLRCCQDTHAAVTLMLRDWLRACRALLVHTECVQTIAPGDLVELSLDTVGLAAGTVVMVKTLDPVRAIVWHCNEEVAVDTKALQPLAGVIPLGLRAGHELWLQGRGCRVRTVVVAGAGTVTCIKTPLARGMVGILNAHELRCPPPNVYDSPDPEVLRSSLLRPGMSPSWQSVQVEMGVLGDSLGTAGMWIGDQATCNVSFARLLHPWGQHPPRAGETAGRIVTISEWNSCACASADCQRRRYCVSPVDWPKDLDRRVADSMLSQSPKDAVPCCPIGSVVLVDGPGRSGHAVVCGGGIDITGQNVVHVVRIGMPRSKPSDVVYACVDAAHVAPVSTDESRRLLEAEAHPNGSLKPTVDQLEMQRALIDEEAAHLRVQQLKKRKKAERKARTALRVAFWRRVKDGVVPRSVFAERIRPFVHHLSKQRREYLTELRQLRDLLDRHAPGVLRCPLSNRPLTDPVYSSGHCFNAKPLREWTDTWGDRSDSRLPVLTGQLISDDDCRVVPIQSLVTRMMRMVGF